MRIYISIEHNLLKHMHIQVNELMHQTNDGYYVSEELDNSALNDGIPIHVGLQFWLWYIITIILVSFL